MSKSNAQKITPEIVEDHGLTLDEYERVLSILGREPNLLELGIFSVMWSEHCSYKSTRKHLRKLPTKGECVVCGPGENAGVIDIGDNQVAIFKMESHNHPSFIEPYQGAATGVGGILRDVFTMGARPIANLNALRFGDINHPKTKHLVNGVVSGIGGYGNCVGVPTVGGECTFHPSYNGNILVNAMTVGLTTKDKIFYSAASKVGSPVVYVGSKTGRDGIHGATMASAEFDDASEEKRPTVQVGDPFTEKLLIEACMELMKEDAILAIQDMGAAGLTSSSFEMAGKGGTGIELHLDKVPTREEGMTGYEIMLSESQERMLMVLKPEKEALARRIFEKWELAFAVIGEVTKTGRMIIKMHGKTEADLPIGPLSEEAPVYDRPWKPTPKRENVSIPNTETSASDILEALKKLIATPDLCSKRWIWEQYDHRVMNDTLQIPGGDAAVVRIHGTGKALALTADCTPRYCYADPVEGGKQAVAEVWRNITAVGAKPLAITNCLNFGNPEKPEIMGQLVGCLEGMSKACEALDFPIVSGNVSLYNETNGNAILPTPAIGGVGLLKDSRKHTSIAFKGEGEVIIRIGDMQGHLGSSLYLREILGREEGAPPPVNLGIEQKNGNFVRVMIEKGLVTACHDVSDGGQLVAIAEMAMAGGIGAELDIALDAARAFGEDQGRYIITAKSDMAERILMRAPEEGVEVTVIGHTGGEGISLSGKYISIAELKSAHEATLPKYLA
ncbi:MAG: phosphoribosylformylglycinamidine synthase subunit PurL [Proteobacteria bacterium]|nr:phosphoribosylformylglycinamidine synthase subunit PurL [Pseudomonadota bacterium]